jgi:hypothetical protein
MNKIIIIIIIIIIIKFLIGLRGELNSKRPLTKSIIIKLN